MTKVKNKMIEWRPIQIDSLFQEFVRGKVLSVIDETKDPNGIPYVGATIRNNGVLDFLVSDTEKKQRGNCIVFIRDGQGSVGLSVYRSTPFVATVNTSSGYSNWLNKYNGIFVSVSSNQVRVKYSFGYKRKEERLLSEKIMLPVNKKGQPDYNYMTKFLKEKQDDLLSKYIIFCKKQIKEIDFRKIPHLEEKHWIPISINSVFQLIRGRENNMALLNDGKMPLISAKKINNGLKGFVSTPNRPVQGNCISLNNDGDGGAGLAYFQPYEMALDTHVTALIPKEKISKWSMLFISECISKLHGFFGHGLSISNKRAEKIQIMLPVNDVGQPDFEYMEQYAKNMMLKKYKQYLSFLERKEQMQ